MIVFDFKKIFKNFVLYFLHVFACFGTAIAAVQIISWWAQLTMDYNIPLWIYRMVGITVVIVAIATMIYFMVKGSKYHWLNNLRNKR